MLGLASLTLAKHAEGSVRCRSGWLHWIILSTVALGPLNGNAIKSIGYNEFGKCSKSLITRLFFRTTEGLSH
jgi:hypothetical protein